MFKTIIISITTIICTLLVCFTLIECTEMNRYVSYVGYDNPAILDHKTGKIYYMDDYHNKIIENDYPNNTIRYYKPNIFGTLELNWDKINTNSGDI